MNAKHVGRGKRSHPPALLTHVRRAIDNDPALGPGTRLLVAVSGGPDSTAMLHCLAHWRSKLGFDLVAAGIDHGLRPEAGQELACAQRIADETNVPMKVIHLTIRSGSNLQSRARDARHRALQDCAHAQGASAIAIGHTSDDRAETVILRLLGGAGPRGLAAMPYSAPGVNGDVRIVRPMLLARRQDVAAHLARHHIQTADDPSNKDHMFRRVRVRNEVIPLLEEMAPRVVEHLCLLAEMSDAVDSPLAGLGRAQRLEVEATLRAGISGATRSVAVRLRGNREMLLKFSQADPLGSNTSASDVPPFDKSS